MSLTTTSPFWFSSGATSAGGGGTVVYPYSIDQSLRFNDNDSAYLSRTPSSDGSRKIFTYSVWFKVGNTGLTYSTLFSVNDRSAGNYNFIRLDSDALRIQLSGGGSNYAIQTNQVLRDVSSWYHLVLSVDTTQATDTNRVKIYINGEQVTSFSTENYPSVNKVLDVNSNTEHRIGSYVDYGRYFDGYMAEINMIDGTALDATSFGETINGIWVPKAYDIADGAYGTNGFYLSFADSAAIGDDLSGNTNDFTVINSVASDVVPDSPTNNFATLNAAANFMPATLTEGNLKATPTSSSDRRYHSTFPISSGKWYCEIRIVSTGTRNQIGFWSTENTASQSVPTNYAYLGVGNSSNATSGTFNGTAFTASAGDILTYAFDADDGKLYFGRNAAPTIGATADFTGLASDTYVLGQRETGTLNTTNHFNFGQDDTFAGAITAGGNSDDNGIGTFKYAPPSGFLAMCSANLPDPAIGPQLASGQQSDDYFEPILYTGNGATQHIGSGGAQHPVDVTTIANSIRFNDNDSAYLNRTPSSASNRKTFTLSTWIKPNPAATNYPPIFNAGTSAPDSVIRLGTTNEIQVVLENGGGGNSLLITNRKLNDSSKWYHILVAVDTTNATADDRIKIYVDGVEETSFSSRTNPSLNLDTNINNTIVHKIGGQRYASYWDGYLAETHFIDGTALDPTSFGQYGSNGYWIPKAVSGLTYGTNGFYLDFSDNSTATALGTDSSGNANNFSATNVATTDQMGDSPTQNFNTFDPNNCYSSGSRLSEGNLRYTHDGANGHHTTTLSFNSSGNWYWEVGLTNSTSAWMGIVDANQNCTGAGSINGYFWYPSSGTITTNPYGTTSSWSTSASAGDIIGFQINNGVMTIYKNGVSLGSPFTIPTSGYYRPFIMSPGATSGITTFNFGADDSFAGSETPSSGAQAADANGYGSFYYTPPTGALAIVDDNIPVEGLTGPDLVWIKERNSTANHYLFDTVRGATKNLHSNTTDSEATDVNSLTSFDYQGFTIGSDAEINTSSNTYVSWNWKAGGKANTFNVDGTGYASMTAAGLTDGDIALTGLSVNTTSGFSIGTYTGIGAAGPSTIAHGLGKQVQLVMVKGRNNSDYSFAVYTRAGDADGSTFMNTGGQVGGTPASTSGLFTQDAFGSGSGTFNNSFFSIGGPNNYTSQSYDYLFYAFANVEGFSKHGKYVGNGSTNGTFVYTGFRPAFVLLKVSSAANNWFIYDNKREGYNQDNDTLSPNLNTVEDTSYKLDLVSNGFKIRGSNNAHNQSGQTFIYLAFAEQPFKYANAR